MRWETKNRINNINQLNKTRQRNKELKNKPIEEIKEEAIETEFNPQKFIEFYELQTNTKLKDYQKRMIEMMFNRDYCTLCIPRYNGYNELLRFVNKLLKEFGLDKCSYEDEEHNKFLLKILKEVKK